MAQKRYFSIEVLTSVKYIAPLATGQETLENQSGLDNYFVPANVNNQQADPHPNQSMHIPTHHFQRHSSLCISPVYMIQCYQMYLLEVSIFYVAIVMEHPQCLLTKFIK